MKPRVPLTFWQIWNMSFGFLGIQFGWGLQMANMSAIYESLGAAPHQLPILWLAAPLTGLIVQPIVGHMSDRTWCRLGRRRPYFLVGALLSSAALVLMPNSRALWMAAGLLWILDASINITMEPFRAFVADVLVENQRTRGFAMQSLFIGLGAVVASAFPWLLTNLVGLGDASTGDRIPHTVKLSFYVGAAAFLGTVLWTIVTTGEQPPADLAAFRRMKERPLGVTGNLAEIVSAIRTMPQVMRELAWVQIFTWLGLFCMWLYFPVAVAHNIFGAADSASLVYTRSIEWAGLCFATYSAICFGCSLWLPTLATLLGRRRLHSLCLLCGATGLISVALISNKYLLLLSMAGVGIAWASILSLPYAMLVAALPAGKVGLYMGIFNFFIVLPEIAASLGFGWIMTHVLSNDRMLAVVTGGGFLMVAAAWTQRVTEVSVQPVLEEPIVVTEGAIS